MRTTLQDIIETPLVRNAVEEVFRETIIAWTLSQEIETTKDKLMLLLSRCDTAWLWSIFSKIQEKFLYDLSYKRVTEDELLIAIHVLNSLFHSFVNFELTQGDSMFDIEAQLKVSIFEVVDDIKKRKLVEKWDTIKVLIHCSLWAIEVEVEIPKNTSILDAQKRLLKEGFPIFDDLGRPYYFLCWHPIYKNVPIVCAVEDDDIGRNPFKERADDPRFDWEQEKMWLFSIIVNGKFVSLDDFEEGFSKIFS